MRFAIDTRSGVPLYRQIIEQVKFAIARGGLSPGDFLKLSVQDTGPGIPDEIVEKIYDPYFTTKEQGKGTGLGLAVVHGIVKNYGGAIIAYSEKGIGTTFNIYLPTIKGPTPGGERIIAPLPRGSEHILLVDDEPTLVDVGKQLLEKFGYQVSTARDGQEAINIFKQSPIPIDLVLTDMTMPKMTGDKLALELLKIQPDIPVILCTGYNLNITEVSALKLGIKAFIYKPIVEADLSRIVRRVLDEGTQTRG